MGRGATGWLLRRKLSQNAARLTSLRRELAQLNEQAEVFDDEAHDQEIRALVSETPGASREANESRKHAEALRRHREFVRDEIAKLEARQDELLDQLTAK